jgi:hypothetical protein
VEDKDRHEHEALERVQQALEQHDRALEQTIEQRLDRGYGMGR